MSRSLTSGTLAQLTAGRVTPVYLASIAFVSGTVYLWTGIGSVSWNGHTWVGLGTYGGVSAITEVNEISAQNVTLTLSGIPSDLLGDAISECRQNTEVKIWIGFLASDGTIVADPAQCFDGHLDVPTIAEGADTSTISVTCENPLIDINRAPDRRYTQDDQAIDYPTDVGFSFVPSIQQWNGVWGKGGSGNSSNSGHGGITKTPIKVNNG